MKRSVHPWLILALLVGTVACGSQKDTTTTPPTPSTKARTSDNRAQVMAVFMDANKARLSGNSGEATRLFEQCIKLDPDNGAAMYELGKLYHAQQRGADAIDMAKRAMNTDKENIWYRFLLADLYLQHGSVDDAITVYQDILKKWPERTEISFDLANALAYSGKTAEARSVYRDLEQRFGRSDELVMEEFGMLANSGDLKSAQNLLEEVLIDDPDNLQFLGMLATLYDEQGETELAYAQYQKVLALDPGNSMARLALAEHFYAQQKMPEAYEQLAMAFSDPDLELDAKMQVLLGFYETTRVSGTGTSAQEEQLKLTYDLIGTLERTHPESGKPHTIHGDFLLRDGRFPEAREEFRTALEKEKDRYPIWQQLLQLDMQLGDHAALVTDATAALELFPTQPAVYLYQGLGLSQLERYDEAIEALVTGRDLVIDDPVLTAQFHSTLGDVYNDAGQFARSDESFDQALKLSPRNPTTLNNYAYYLSLRNDRLEKAAEMSKRSNELAPGQPSFQDTYAWIFYQQQRYADARTWIEKALANGGAGEGLIVEHYGDILYRLGDAPGALEQWKKAQALGGTSEEIDRKVSEGKLVE